MINTTHLNVERIGEGNTPLLMLHGWGHSLHSLKPLGSLLSSVADIHLIDLPGFGLSEHPQDVWDSFHYADRIISYLDNLGIARIDLLGHSFGGKVAMSLAHKYPERVHRLILLAAQGIPRKRTFKEKCRLQSIKWMGKGIKRVDRLLKTNFFKDKFSSKFGSPDYVNAGHMRPILVKSVNENMTSYIANIKTPSLLLWGEQDDATPAEVARRLKKLLTNSQLFLFPGKGHLLFEDGGAHLCASYILSFLNESIKSVK